LYFGDCATRCERKEYLNGEDAIFTSVAVLSVTIVEAFENII